MGTGGRNKLHGVLHNIIEYLNYAIQAYHFEGCGSNPPHPFFKNTQISGVYTFRFGADNKRYRMTIESDEEDE